MILALDDVSLDVGQHVLIPLAQIESIKPNETGGSTIRMPSGRKIEVYNNFKEIAAVISTHSTLQHCMLPMDEGEMNDDL